MGGLTGAVHWWEESQLRVLVLTSLAIQFLLFIFAIVRRLSIPGWFRSIIWLAYLGGDAVAIYALATLFNRHKAGEDGGGGSSSTTLEVVWAPVLLLHLGGQDGINAYNIEDNELWTRHLLTAVSQVTVAIYVFSKSWPPDGDKRLLQAAIVLFVPGILRCLAKPIALKSASIHNLVSSKVVEQNQSEIYTLEEYVTNAKEFVKKQFAQEHKNEGDGVVLLWRTEIVVVKDSRRSMERLEEFVGVSKLFVDLSSSHRRRLCILERKWRLSEDRAYDSVRKGLAGAFLRLYTRLKTSEPAELAFVVQKLGKVVGPLALLCIAWTQLSRMALPWAAIGLFHKSHREAYSGIDVNITYALFCCTAVLEAYSATPASYALEGGSWPEKVAQYSLIQFVARNKRHSNWITTASLFGCKDFLDQHWCMKSCSSSSSAEITELVLGYLKDGWKEEIQDAASYLRFNDHSRHWVLEKTHCGSQVPGLMSRTAGKTLRPFDESVLLWHMATDFCFFLTSFSGSGTSSFVDDRNNPTSSQRRQELKCKAGRQCRQMSNYMMYLLFVNPEMLLPGTRRNIFETAYGELMDILPDDKKPSLFAEAYEEVKDILFRKDNNRNWFSRVTAAFREMKDILRDNKRNPLSWSQWKAAPVKEEFLMKRLINAMKDKPKQSSEEELKEGCTEEPTAPPVPSKKQNFIDHVRIFLFRKVRKNGYKEYLATPKAPPVPPRKENFFNHVMSIYPGYCREIFESATVPSKKENFINDAWILAQRLWDKGEEKMWEEIEKVWVEMLCFSASRCRGYLHAKALGNGGEFLSYIWLLLFHMGMETFTDKLQRQEHQSWGGNNGTAPAPPLVSEVSTEPSPSSSSEASTGAAIPPAEVHMDVAPSTSEIRMAAEDMV